MRARSWSLLVLLFAASCGEAPIVSDGAPPPRGAAIDGSEDLPASVATEPEAPLELESQPEPAPPEEGPLAITYQDLSLVDYDVDAMLDHMLFPEEYDEEDAEYLAFPEELTRLTGREVSIVGYMIPGDMKQGEVQDFMLVRDLLGCCFGGTPMPDEWVDVVMAEGESAEYRPYLPMRVTGVLTLGGEQDEAGFAMGIYKMVATDVHVED
jgi:hypothetical protein